MDEFRLIAELWAPLSRDFPGAMALTDDVALVAGEPATDLALTTDTIVAGVHFFPDTAPDLIARKLIRVTLSDLAAKGAAPFAVLLAASFPRDTDHRWLTRFAAGLGEDLSRFGCALIGGDTVATSGPLTLSLTAMGRVPKGAAILRSGAKAGDTVWVSGTIGDGALGLAVAEGKFPALTPDARAYLLDRYHLPQPRIATGQALRGVAHAGMDISDGLIQDLGHLCAASGVSARISAPLVPVSKAARAVLVENDALLATMLTGGDDYELLFTAPHASGPALQVLAADLDVPLTAIGTVGVGEGVTVVDDKGQVMAVPRTGWRHFVSTASG